MSLQMSPYIVRAELRGMQKVDGKIEKLVSIHFSNTDNTCTIKTTLEQHNTHRAAVLAASRACGPYSGGMWRYVSVAFIDKHDDIWHQPIWSETQ